MSLHTGDVEYVVGSPRGSGPERVFHVRLTPDDAGRRAEEIADGIRGGSIPNGVLLTRCSTPFGVEDVFAARGFDIDTSGVCMALDLAELTPSGGVSSPISVAPVATAVELTQWVKVINVAFAGEPIMTHDQFCDLHDQDYARMYIGSWDGTPASVAMTLRDDDTATVEMVATLAAYRQRGLAGAVIAVALQELSEAGVRVVTLRAEPNAASLYRSVGFRDCYPRIVASLP